MEIALAGPGAARLCETAAIPAQCFSSLSDVRPARWDVLALTRGVPCPASQALTVHSLLLPGDMDRSAVQDVHAAQAVTYGFSPRDTLTLSSLAGHILCLQRSLKGQGGILLEPQEFPLPASFAVLSAEESLLAAGLLLLTRGALT